tara:strand:+ start:250 stop:609 length:360 start_codon:yes stop_codon:yes gene_type:complete
MSTIKIKKKPLSPAQKKKDAAIMKAEEARRKRQKDKLRKDASKSHYSSVTGYKGKGGQQNLKAKSYREKLADEKRANIRESARGKMTLQQSKVAGKLVNLNKKVKSLQKQIQTLSKGRK